MPATTTPQVVGQYALHGKIAAGGMATVHFGRQMGAGGFTRTVAVKRLHPHLAEDPAFRSTMLDEGRLAARIHHPNVVPVLDIVSLEGELLLVMEYVRGESLARLLRTGEDGHVRAPLAIVSAVVIGALHGLHAAHEATDDRGAHLAIVHRDVSPQNILVGIDGMARVIDFGVAKASGRMQTTREGVVKGKMAYMAPEQLEGRAVDRSVDIYAMGIVLWEALAGRRLFEADVAGQLLVKVLAGAEHPPGYFAPGIAPELDALVMKALALERADRFATAEEMAEELRRIAPPAFPTDVGKWVQESAREAITERGKILADIESGVATGPSGRALHPSRPDAGADDIVTRALEPSTGAMVSSRRGIATGTRVRAILAVASVGLIFAVVLLVWLLRPAPNMTTASSSGQATSVNAPAASVAVASVPSVASVAAVAETVAAPVVSTAPPPVAPDAGAAAAPRKPRGPAPKTGPIRFAQPD